MQQRFTIKSLNFSSTLGSYANAFLMWAAREPYTFLFYVLAFLSPFFAFSAFLSWKLSKALERQEREMNRRRAVSRARKKSQ